MRHMNRKKASNDINTPAEVISAFFESPIINLLTAKMTDEKVRKKV